jgi:dihydrofolate reductase
MTKKIVAIWAQDKSGIIGKSNKLPWHLPKDLKHFKETTLNQAILMGRVTFEGMNKRLLPNRETLILTTQSDYQVEGATVVTSVKEVLTWYTNQDKPLYIVGGSQVYKLFETYVDELVVTQVQTEVDGDTYFPRDFDFSRFSLVSSEFYEKVEQNKFDFTIEHYVRV